MRRITPRFQNTFKHTVAFISSVYCAYASTQAAYYVDPATGFDSNSGTLTAPFETIKEARDTVRSVNDSMTGDIVVYLRGGVYALNETLELDAQDSGTNGYRVIYRNYPHEEPIITGGRAISEWTDVGGGIYAASADSMAFNQLSVNGRPAQRARHPEYGSPYKILTTNPFNQRIKINLTEIEAWTGNLGRMEMVIASSFTSSRLRIEQFVASDDNGDDVDDVAFVTPKDPERAAYWGWLDGPLEGTPSYYFENHIDFLDTPGEWFLDLDTDIVYYMPKDGEDMPTADVCAPQLEQLLSVEDAEYLTFFGLTFEHASWLAPMERGMVQRQGSMEVLRTTYDEANEKWKTAQFNVVPVATYFKQISNVRIERCVFMNMGAAAMGFDTGTNNNTVVGNVFSEIAESGIIYDMDNYRFATGDALSTLDTFDSNYFFRIGTLYYGGTGLFAFWPDQITITHNEFAQINGLGMNVGWGATSDPVATKQAVVTHNRMHDVSVRARDSGAIHTKSNQAGATGESAIDTGGLYSRNWIYNSTPRTWWDTGPERYSHGIYLDDASEYATVSHNVFMNIHDTDLKIKGDTHTFINNGSQDQTIKDESGLRDGYLDIKDFWRGGAIGRDLEPGDAYSATGLDLGVLFDDSYASDAAGSQPAGYTYDETGGVIEVVSVSDNSIRMRDNNTDNSIGTTLSRNIGEQSGTLTCTFRMKAGQTTNSLFFYLFDDAGKRACQVGFSGNGNLRYFYQDGTYIDIATYAKNTWYTFRLEVDVQKQTFSVWIDDTLVLGDCMFYHPTENLTSLRFQNSFKTGYFDLDYLTVESDLVASSSVTTQGTPYAWMDQHYDTTGWTPADYEAQDAKDDDFDGASTGEEYLAGTTPADPSSVFKVLSLGADENDLSFSWKTLRDRNYTIQSSIDLQPDSWGDVINLPGNGGLKQFSAAIEEGAQFYRVVIKE
ncbi:MULTISPECIES: right-handed parallel beta-helix repeat-containing protein [unclassified Lentimonas]|uniref:right-handed parallel beta-helix repeat-containing protein n=1 Tax=unclassified Lentimonas TaxID=2630993 RepID=UPI0013236D6C|nr:MULTISPECIES: right-handed parallel beta-helix repeat-containing protein [unclassified Lentimonas]CAA6691653.1 Unannotated [Lentimonas sp. CC19]CAA6692257.1 Unannotated [Lentimonas sp. CC10]CAA7070199.1 Unannotated [Lentimonas sp. CC11]